MIGNVSVPLDERLFSEIVLRLRRREGATAIVDHAVRDFLDRTRNDPEIWSAEYLAEVSNSETMAELEKFGPASQGYEWQGVLLPNGTELRMKYNSSWSYATIQHRELVYRGESLSPSQFASKVADGTSRSAPRDLEIKRPQDRDWLSIRLLKRMISEGR